MPPIYQAHGQPPPPPSPPTWTQEWVPIYNFHDTLYWQIGRFAVLMFKLTHKKDITLVDVLSVSMQPAGIGKNYFLELKVADEYKKVGKYNTLVWGVPGSTAQPWQVLQFQFVGN